MVEKEFFGNFWKIALVGGVFRGLRQLVGEGMNSFLKISHHIAVQITAISFGVVTLFFMEYVRDVMVVHSLSLLQASKFLCDRGAIDFVVCMVATYFFLGSARLGSRRFVVWIGQSFVSPGLGGWFAAAVPFPKVRRLVPDVAGLLIFFPVEGMLRYARLHHDPSHPFSLFEALWKVIRGKRWELCDWISIRIAILCLGTA